MGRQVIAALGEPDTEACLAGILLHRTPPPAALAVPAFTEPSALAQAVDIVLDFSAPAACARVAPACAAAGRPYVVASTALSSADMQALAQAAQRIAVLQAANLSVGVNVLMELVELAAQRLPHADLEVCELHHRHKRDAPSGTALALGAAATAGRAHAGQTLVPALGRRGDAAQRATHDIGYAALRGGDAAGEHTVYVLGDGERLELSHRCSHPSIFAAGALTACRWLASRAPGHYSMRDVVQNCRP
jgi:4-hydroxy-tetrahydrodipicolinate reductase